MKNQQGFTLFEVVIAMAIMASSALLLTNAWSGNQLRVKKTLINNRAAFLLDRTVAELETEYATKLTQIPEADTGKFENYPDYSWVMKSQKFEMPDLRSALVAAGQGEESTLMIIDKMTEFFNESIVEMKVTILYSHKKKSVKYSATTFMVNFDKPLPLPGGGGG